MKYIKLHINLINFKLIIFPFFRKNGMANFEK